MSGFFLALAIDVAIFALAGAMFVWRYRSTVGRDAQRKVYQYRFFALRDRAIRLAIEGLMQEDDPRWQRLYAHTNDSARAARIDSMRNGLTFVGSILRNVRPLTKDEMDEVEGLPKPAKDLLVDYVQTVLQVCMEGSFVLRRLVWLAGHFGRVKRWLEQLKPEEVRNFRRWRLSAERLSPCHS